jgi:magnesium-transporting ATPase (P-type)
MMVGALGLFLYELDRGTALETARTMAVNVVVGCEMLYLLCSRSLFASIFRPGGLLGNRWVVVSIVACIPLQLLYTYAPPMQKLFGSTALSLDEWGLVIAASSLVLIGSEVEKWALRRFDLHPQARLHLQ